MASVAWAPWVEPVAGSFPWVEAEAHLLQDQAEVAVFYSDPLAGEEALQTATISGYSRPVDSPGYWPAHH